MHARTDNNPKRSLKPYTLNLSSIPISHYDRDVIAVRSNAISYPEPSVPGTRLDPAHKGREEKCPGHNKICMRMYM